MQNNHVIRRIRYIFDLKDTRIVKLISMAGQSAELAEVTAWLKKDEDPGFMPCRDSQLAAMLNGLIIDRRGRKDGPLPPIEKTLNNNQVLKKLKIALNYQSDDMLQTFRLVEATISEHELSAFFRKPGHKHYRECMDQWLKRFLDGLAVRFQGA